MVFGLMHFGINGMWLHGFLYPASKNQRHCHTISQMYGSIILVIYHMAHLVSFNQNEQET